MKTSLNFHRCSMKKIFFFASIAFLCNASVLWSATRNVVADYGADNTGASYATVNIQNAINACQPGDVLFFPDGTYLMDSGLTLKSNDLTVIISPGALIKANTIYVWRENGSDLFFGENLKNIEITGGGIIDGGGLVYERSTRPYDKPGRGIELIGCTNVNIHHLTVRNIPNFAVNIERCNLVIVDNMLIRGRPFDNFRGSADGIDIQSCFDVTITNCDIEVGDDALCLKVKPDAPLHKVRIKNCILASSCNAFKIGTDTKNDVYDIIAENVIINKHSNPAESGQDPISTGDCISAITVQSNDNTNVHDVTIRNFTINSCYNPIYLELQNRGNHSPFNGTLSNILIENINCKKATVQPVVFNYDCAETTKIEDVTLNNITVYNYSSNAGVVPTCMNGNYPEVKNNGIANAYGIWARGIDGLDINSCDFINTGNSSRPRTYFENTTADVHETDGCTRIPIDPFSKVNNGAYRNVPITVAATGAAVTFGPQPTDGSWSWTGPNGFNSNSREVTVSNIQDVKYGTYTATYTNSCGAISTMDFEITNKNIYEAENALINEGTINDGATGRYVDLNAGGSLKWGNVNMTTAGTYNLAFNVAVYSASTRKMGLYVNGTKKGVITSSSLTFAEVSLSTALNQGNNVIELRDSEGTTELNVDYLAIKTTSGGIAAKSAKTAETTTESLTEEGLYIYPNPNKGIINIDFNGEKYTSIEIYNSTGSLVYSGKVKEENSFKADLSSTLKTGIYLVSLKSGSKVSNKKLMVN
ncbi:glycosyl hydrolase family 28 protein [Flavobacterium pectinovorum]|uniref:T9SS C-terminal target domain-containing protein n=1 Tax=Flavobacterium pectinovorum TaxID=29533 RepID=A0A502EBY4_9FLAO|nr:glycosyl hydrolase family 28 protein [Flavobacterium pectinovorum]TPG33901.1 T9SS C-terminal target domain-containing protein [Flavobacterium pectinovorum]